jgi:hypothetical protein
MLITKLTGIEIEKEKENDGIEMRSGGRAEY